MRSGLAAVLVALLSACALAADPTVEPSATPPVSATPMPAPSQTEVSTPSPPPMSSPATPPPTPDPAAMSLEVTTCDGGAVLRWSASTHPDFHHYIGLRSSERDVAPQYPPIAPAIDWGDLYATDRFVTSGYDASLLPNDTEWHYKVVAYDVDGKVVSQSNVDTGTIEPARDLGTLRAEVLDDGTVRLSWGGYDGSSRCFSAYRVLHGTSGVAGTLLTSVSDQLRTEIDTGALHAGVTYTLRVEAVRTTTIGHFTVGESESLTFEVPTE